MFEKIIPILQRAEKVGIFVHTNPDGDAMGSSYSLKLALQSMGKAGGGLFIPPCGLYGRVAGIRQSAGRAFHGGM